MFDLAFVLRDCHGDIEAAQRRVDRALREARAEGMREIAKRLEKPKDVMQFVYSGGGMCWGRLADAIGELEACKKIASGEEANVER